MGYGLKLLFLFLWVCSLYTIGILIFTKGFLLKRLVIPEKSECSTRESFWRFNFSSNSIGSQSVAKKSCSLPSTYSKAVLLIIDALRYDFAFYDDSLETESNGTLPYQIKLTVIHELLTRSPDNGRLYRFIADPPTTTMQRLKGLTTGSLPTFVDAGSNFASYEITEDNFITKLVEHGKKLTFMGDDTWEGLFPGTFNKSFPFPSFNVKDLHTVDNGVIQHLVPELQLGDWDVLISHFLGVDHCGHKYGPNHRAMADKLTQMDQVIRSVIEAIDNDTVLFVLGDHGMTRTGDHGGDSKDELDAALFVFSPSPLLHDKPAQSAVSQVDLVPTISLLLGLPIPFGNLGTVITDLFTCQHHVKQMLDALELGTMEQAAARSLALGLRNTEVLQLNAFQVQTYLNKYVTVSGEMPRAKLEALSKDLEAADLIMNDVRELLSSQSSPSEKKAAQINLLVEKLSFIGKKYVNYLAEIKELCQTLWAKFDMVSIFFGLCILVISILINVLLLALPSEMDFGPVLRTVLYCLGIGGALSFSGLAVDFVGPLSAIAITLGLSATGFVYSVIKTKTSQGTALLKFLFHSLLLEDLMAFGVCTLYGVAVFSNSFVVNEDNVVYFLVNSMIAVVVCCAFRKLKSSIVTKIFARTSTTFKKPKKENRKTDLLLFLFSDSVKLLLAVIVFFSCGRLAAVFRACREEQWTCEQSMFLQQLAALGTEDSGSADQRILIATFSVFIIPIALRKWLSRQGNLNGSSPATLCTKYGLILVPFLMSLHWILQLVPPQMAVLLPNLQLWQQVILPQAVYWICLMTILLLVWNPLLIFLILRDKNRSFSDTLESYRGTENMDLRVIQLLFKEVKKKFDQRYSGSSNTMEPEKQGDVPLVYGLATVYSSSLCALLVALVLPLVMILGDGLPGSVLCLFVQVLMLLEIHGCTCDLRSRKDDMEYKGPSWSVVILWVMLGSQYFYFTGHQATIPAIRFEAAFVGLPGDLGNLVLPGLLIFLNTFASHVIFAAALPLLFFWPIIPSRLLSGRTSPAGVRGDITDKGELVCNQHSRMLRTNIWRTLLMYLTVAALKVFATACSAAVHRRHLMVWKIFAPRFVFEGASFLVTIPVLTLVYVFVLRVDVTLTQWTQTLETYCQETHTESHLVS